MRFFLVFALLGFGLQGWSKPHLSRQWSRSTLEKPHFKYRYLNRMAPLLTESLVIQGNGVDGIRAYNRKSGHLVWGLNLQDGVEGGAVLDGNRLYFGSTCFIKSTIFIIHIIQCILNFFGWMSICKCKMYFRISIS